MYLPRTYYTNTCVWGTVGGSLPQSAVGFPEQLIDLGLHSKPGCLLWLQAVISMRQRSHSGKPSRLAGQT
ncbi:hypothetical protein BgiBS90_026664, partial [Biomphalaria glabrata]